jgi:hypothetical protein
MNLNLLVRGDLRSEFGAARHLRDQLNLFSVFFTKIIGVDLHYHPKFDKADFPYEIMSDSEARTALARDSASNWTVLHHVTPEHFIRFPNCYNLGYFVWETNKPPENSNWECSFRELDGLWVSAPFLIGMAEELGWTKPVEVVPWPMTPMALTGQIPNLANLKVHQVAPKEISSIGWKEFNERGEEFFFSVASDAPRKALPVLLSEWVGYKRKSKKSKSLLLKISTFNFSKTEEVLLRECQKFLQFACGGENRLDADFFVIAETLSEGELAFLYDSCQAFVTTTVGEGFGGPIAEAALLGKAVLSPRHSSLESLLPSGYPFVLPHEMVTLGQGPDSFYAASSQWGLIQAGALSGELIELDSMPAEDLETQGESLRNFVSEVCNPEKVKATMEAFFLDQIRVIEHGCKV